MTADEFQNQKTLQKKAPTFLHKTKPSYLSKATNLRLINPLNVSTIYDINAIAIKRYIQSAGLEAANFKWCDHA